MRVMAMEYKQTTADLLKGFHNWFSDSDVLWNVVQEKHGKLTFLPLKGNPGKAYSQTVLYMTQITSEQFINRMLALIHTNLLTLAHELWERLLHSFVERYISVLGSLGWSQGNSANLTNLVTGDQMEITTQK